MPTFLKENINLDDYLRSNDKNQQSKRNSKHRRGKQKFDFDSNNLKDIAEKITIDEAELVEQLTTLEETD